MEKITAQVGQILNAVPAVNELTQREVKAKTAYWLVKVSRKLQSTIEDFYKARQTLDEKYGVAVKEDGSPDLPEDHREAYREELNELLQETVEINVRPFDIESFDGVEVSALTLGAVDFIFKDPFAEPEPQVGP